MRCVLTGDWHLEAGSALGVADAELGNSRLADARRILRQICNEQADVLVFLGDLARTAHPKPSAYRVAQQALREGAAKAVLLIPGNHDFTGEANTCVHVVAGDLPRARVFDKPALTVPAGLQVGVLPWTPPTRMFGAAPHNPREMNRIVAEKLEQIAQGLGAKLDASKPSLLIGHWLLGGGQLQTGSSVVEAAEPVLDVVALEAAGFDVAVFGHNHVAQQVSKRCWHCGPPMRGDFGEAEVPTGYMVIDWPPLPEMLPALKAEMARGRMVMVERPWPTVRHVPVEDHKLLTITQDELTADWHLHPNVDVRDAIVKVRLAVSETQAEALLLAGGRGLRALAEELLAAGAVKVIGPTLDVQRAPRERRSEMTVKTDPAAALSEWLDGIHIDPALRELVEAEGARVMK